MKELKSNVYGHAGKKEQDSSWGWNSWSHKLFETKKCSHNKDGNLL